MGRHGAMVGKIDPVIGSFAAIASFDRRRREYRRLGWIYACRNRSFTDPVFKIGQSSRPPHVRIAELSSSSAVYRDFQLVYFVHVSDRDPAEGQAHLALQGYRVNPNKEFFQAPLPEIVHAMDAAASMFPVQLGKTSRAGFLPQPLQPRHFSCPHCGAQNRLANVLIEIRISCGSCGERLEVAPGASLRQSD